MRSRLRELYNESQLDAIQNSLKVEGVTLIQGPPGTGKTTTVLATISVLLNAFFEQTNQTQNSAEQDSFDGIGKL